MEIILRTVIMGGVIFGVSTLLPGIKLKNFFTALKVAVVYSIIHIICFKLLMLLSLPFIIITLGLFILVIQACLLWVTDQFIDDFEIDGFGTTLLASLLITIGSSVLNWLIL